VLLTVLREFFFISIISYPENLRACSITGHKRNLMYLNCKKSIKRADVEQLHFLDISRSM